MGVYRPPGVYAIEEVRSIIPSPIAREDVVAIVSEVPPSAPNVELVTLQGLLDVQLQKKGIVGSSIEIVSRDETVTYLNGTDYTVTSTSVTEYNAFKKIRRVNNTATETFTLDSGTNVYQPVHGRGIHDVVITTASPSKTYVEYIDYVYDPYTNKVTALPGSTIPRDGTTITMNYKYGIEDGETVQVRYRYSDEDYYAHQLYNSLTEVISRFGLPWNKDGTPNPMSLAASMVFTNGGPETQVMCIPVNPHFYDVTKTTPSIAEWQAAFSSITEDEISLVVETSGLVDFQGYLVANVLAAANYQQARIGIMGRDFTKDGAGRAELRAYAEAVNNQRIVLVSPSLWETLDTLSGDLRQVGGQYAAAAIAGMLTRERIQDTMTRRPFIGLRTKHPEPEAVLTQDTATGLFVIENKKGFMRVRHAVTTAFTNINTRELNVVRAKDFMIKSLREALDRSVIGMLMEPDVDFLVMGAATNVLDRMREAYVIADFNDPQVFQDPTDPTRLRLRFTYIPNYPVNEILIEFSVGQLGASLVNA